MHAHIAFDSDLEKLSHELFANLRQPEALGHRFEYARYEEWKSLWNRQSRLFHGLSHMFAMSELDKDLPSRAGIYAMVGGFMHDIEYPSIGEEVTHVSQRFIDTYIDRTGGKHVLKPLDPNDRAGHLLYGIFGFEAGHELSAFPIFADGKLVNPGGLNEFYSAAAAVGELKELGKDDQFIAGVVAVIEATVPFRQPSRMDDLRGRIERTSAALNMDLTPNDIDEMMMASVYTANKDVSGFLGGLDPLKDTQPTTQSVLNTIQGGDMLSPEEIPSMRTAGKARNTPPGDYPASDFLKARAKRAGLYQLVIGGNAAEGTIGNLFFETTLSGGDVYPPQPWKENANKLAYANNLPVRTAEYARLVSQAIVHSIASSAGASTDPETAKLIELVSGIGERLRPQLPTEVSQVRQLAFHAVNGRHKVNGGDTPRSPLAELVLSQIDEHQVAELGLVARKLVAPAPGTAPLEPKQFLQEASKVLGSSVARIRDEMVQTARIRGNQTAALALSQVSIDGPDLPKH